MITVLLLLAACGGGGETAVADGRLNVVTTTGHIGDAAKIIGGERVRVTSLMGPGLDPHLYVASEGDVRRLSDADLILYNGLFLEARMSNVLEQIGRGKPAVAVAEAVPETQRLLSQEYADAYDPHVWFDVKLWQIVVAAVRDALITADPDHAALYEANAAAYLSELAELEQYVQDQAARIPPAQRVLITAHDAFGYFGRAYGFEVMGLQGISTEAEASAADVQSLADFIAANQIPAIFIESSVPVRTVEAVQAAVTAQGFQVAIGGELFSDALGDQETPEGSYVGMVRHNIDTIVEALSR
ncbi:MAG: zinc ABC transporter substrate-binding protein [Chloroflexi bacterium]|nr:zinc ABC transporter substrate-binding protein [Chloroflexota bacterium]